jgi:hypothetical protein
MDKAFAGTQSLYLYDNLNTAPSSVSYDFGETLTKGYLEFSIQRRQSSTGNGGTYVYFRDTGSGTTNFSMAISSSITLFGPTGTSLVAETATNAGYTSSSNWYTFRISFDESTNTASVSLNGTSIGALSVSSGSFDSVNWRAGQIEIRAGTNSTTLTSAYIDNVSVVDLSSIPEPSTYAVLAGLSALMLGFTTRRRRA